MFVVFVAFLSSCQLDGWDHVKEISAAKDSIRNLYAPDKRVALFDVQVTYSKDQVVLKGETNKKEAINELIKTLEQKGYIKGYTALLNHEKIDLSITAFAHVSLDDHHAQSVKFFDKAISQWPEVQECHATSGDYDYLLKIITKDMKSYNNFMYQRLMKLKGIRSVNTSFSMMQKKVSTKLPLTHLISS